jgi:hypothetical protein
MAHVVGPQEEHGRSGWDWLLFAVGLVLVAALLIFAFTTFLPTPPVGRG